MLPSFPQGKHFAKLLWNVTIRILSSIQFTLALRLCISVCVSVCCLIPYNWITCVKQPIDCCRQIKKTNPTGKTPHVPLSYPQPSGFFFSPPSQTCHLCASSAVLCFLKCHVNGIIRCAVSGDWPFPQNNSLRDLSNSSWRLSLSSTPWYGDSTGIISGGALFFLAFLTNDCGILVNPGCHLPGEVGKGRGGRGVERGEKEDSSRSVRHASRDCTSTEHSWNLPRTEIFILSPGPQALQCHSQ